MPSFRYHIFFVLSFILVSINKLQASPYPTVTDAEWEKIVPHLIPDAHPAKPALDKAFMNDRASVYDIGALKNKGFFHPSVKGLHVHTLFHHELPGYLLKIYRYAYHGFTPKGNDWQSWLQRIEGAEKIRHQIESRNYQKYFVVPKKWIYALPHDPTRDVPINFILVVEDMNLVSKEMNLKYYQKYITKNHLKRVFKIVTDVGLSDGCSHNNLFWTKNKKLAFVDTESHGRWPVHYYRMLEYLTPTMRSYWKRYVISKGEDPNY